MPNYNDQLSRSPPKYYSSLVSAPINPTLLSSMIKSKNENVYRPLAYTIKPGNLVKNVVAEQAKAFRINLGQTEQYSS